MNVVNEPKLTPTAALVVEVLTARARLGELFWPFDKAVSKAVTELERLGLVYTSNSGVSFTAAGETRYLRYDYRAPILWWSRRDVHGGAPCFYGTSVQAHQLDSMFDTGASNASITYKFPDLTSDQINAARRWWEHRSHSHPTD